MPARTLGPRRVDCEIPHWLGLGLLLTVSESNIGQCASEDTGPKEGRLRDPTLIGEGNEAFLIRLGYRLAVSLGCY